MPSTYSPILRIELITNGEQSGLWGTTTNTNLGTLIEQAIAGTATISVAAGDVTLTNLNGASDQARCMALKITGSPGVSRNVIAPAVSKVYVVDNGSDAAVVLKTSTSTGLTVPAGKIQVTYYNGTDFVLVGLGSVSGGTGISTSTVAGAVTVTNTGVTSAVAGSGISVSGGTGAVTFTNTGVLKDSSTGAAYLPSGTTAQRPGVPSSGYFRFNSDLIRFEGYNGSVWGSVGGATGGGTDAVFYENGTTVTTDYTITTNKNAMSAGPITIDSGITVTVPPGSVWTVVGA